VSAGRTICRKHTEGTEFWLSRWVERTVLAAVFKTEATMSKNVNREAFTVEMNLRKSPRCINDSLEAIFKAEAILETEHRLGLTPVAAPAPPPQMRQ
jgi:hypothetical protein